MSFFARIFKFFLLIAGITLAGACAVFEPVSPPPVTEASTPEGSPSVPAVGSENFESLYSSTAKLVFFRAALAASGVEAAVYDVTQGAPLAIGKVGNESQLHVMLPAGDHTLMLVAEDAIDYLRVSVSAGQEYHCWIKPTMGVWRPSFAFVPIVASAEHGDAQVHADEVMGKTQRVYFANAPFVDRAASEVMVKHTEHWPKWRDGGEAIWQDKHLRAVDGRAIHSNNE